MNSCLYVGQVRHRRFTPSLHKFSYRLFYVYLDLDELDTAFRKFRFWSTNKRNIASFSESDHLKSYKPEQNACQSLADRVRRYIRDETGDQLDGPIRLLTHFSYFGFRFNPVSFYYCFAKDTSTLKYIIAEVNNTPWGEQYCYLIPANRRDTGHVKHKTNKRFHVSPFMPMDMQYQFSMSHPGQTLSVHMQNQQHSNKVFDATLTLEQKEITTRNLACSLLRFPFLTVKVMFAIYYQAVILLIKRIPVFDHPDNTATDKVKQSVKS